MKITDIILDAVLVCALLPVVISFTSNVSGASATEQVLLGLVATFNLNSWQRCYDRDALSLV